MMPWNRDSKEYDEISLDALEPAESTDSNSGLAPNRYNSAHLRSHSDVNPSHSFARGFLHSYRNTSYVPADDEVDAERSHRSYLRTDAPRSASHSRERTLNDLFTNDRIADNNDNTLTKDELELIRSNIGEAIGKDGVGSWLSSTDDTHKPTKYPERDDPLLRSSPRGRSVSPNDISYFRDSNRISVVSRAEEGIHQPEPIQSTSDGLPRLNIPDFNNGRRVSMPARHISDYVSDTGNKDTTAAAAPDEPANAAHSLQRPTLSSLMRRLSSRVISAAPDLRVESDDESDYLYPPRHSQLADSTSTLQQSRTSNRPSPQPQPILPLLDEHITISTEEQEAGEQELQLESHQSPQPLQPLQSQQSPVPPRPALPHINLSGTSLKTFGPRSKLRLKLFYLLKQPWVDPLIFILIILNTLFLAYQLSGNIFHQPVLFPTWGSSWLDIAFLIIYIFYTVEICSKIIVQGFFDDSEQFEPISTDGTLMSDFNNIVVSSNRKIKVSNAATTTQPSPPYAAQKSQTVVKSFSNLVRSRSLREPQSQDKIIIVRAFLRTSWNRVDFIAISAYWLSFILQVSHVEQNHQFFVFRAISSLRVLRLLSLTQGTSAVLQGMKKSASLLGNVVIFIGFFW